jgi:hypothetical protein
VVWDGIASKVVIPAVVAPFVCGAAGFLATKLAYGASRSVDPEEATRGFRYTQIISSSLVALAHGTNDAQKTMGVVVLTLVAGDRLGADAGDGRRAELAHHQHVDHAQQGLEQVLRDDGEGQVVDAAQQMLLVEDETRPRAGGACLAAGMGSPACRSGLIRGDRGGCADGGSIHLVSPAPTTRTDPPQGQALATAGQVPL